MRLLKELGCDEAQGFLISGPLPASEVLAFAASKVPVGGPSADADWRPAASA
jgi:hypothetical protein